MSSDRSGHHLNVNLVSPQSVIVSDRPRTSSHALAGLVVATPISASMPSNPPKATRNTQPPAISKVLIKACSKGNKKDSKTFSLRNINQCDVASVEMLKGAVRSQLQGEISQTGDFDVRYLQGSSVVSIRSREDLLEIWAGLQKGGNTILWCNGLRKASKRTQLDFSSGDEPEEASKSVKRKKKEEEKEDRVEETIKDLKKKNGENTYTSMQYRIWAEMVIGGVHKSINSAPSSTMLFRAGGAKKRGEHSTSTVSSNGTSPAKVIDNRTKCYKQLSDLKHLFDSGIMPESVYIEEKTTIMAMLKKLV